MADEKDVEKQQAPPSSEDNTAEVKVKPQENDSKTQEPGKETEKTDETQQAGIVKRILPWIIMAVIVLVCVGAGFGLGRLFAGSDKAQPVESSSSQRDRSVQEGEYLIEGALTEDSEKTWYYELEPVVANLDVPGVTRYVRAALILEIDAAVHEKKGIVLVEEKKPILTNWLAIYLAGLTLEDIRGEKNQRRIQSHIRDAFNEKLFPDAKPRIEHILFKEFAIQ